MHYTLHLHALEVHTNTNSIFKLLQENCCHGNSMMIYWQFFDIFLFTTCSQRLVLSLVGQSLSRALPNILVLILVRSPCPYPCPSSLSLSLADLLIFILAKETLSQLLQNCSSANHWTSACWAIPALEKSADHFCTYGFPGFQRPKV